MVILGKEEEKNEEAKELISWRESLGRRYMLNPFRKLFVRSKDECTDSDMPLGIELSAISAVGGTRVSHELSKTVNRVWKKVVKHLRNAASMGHRSTLLIFESRPSLAGRINTKVKGLNDEESSNTVTTEIIKMLSDENIDVNIEKHHYDICSIRVTWNNDRNEKR